jgi:SAM-dependent methyltransferase
MSADWERRAEELAADAIAAGRPTAWFDRLYAEGEAGTVGMPWDRDRVRPPLARWTAERGLRGHGRRAVVVGCGLGMDAEHVASLGYDTTAFDVAETAIRVARRRHPASPVRYQVADLLRLPEEWRRAFDLVVEVYTVQALPEPPRRQAIAAIAGLVAPGGTLVVIARARTRDVTDADIAGPPWPLTRADVDAFATGGLEPAGIEQRPDPDQPQVLRWQAELRRPAAT